MNPTTVGLLSLVLWLTWPFQSVDPIRYYRLESVKTVKGEIIQLDEEIRSDKSPFIVIRLRESHSDKEYRIEVSPKWFFDLELVVGSQLEVRGSDLSTGEEHTLIAAEIIHRGERHRFRDANGFPLWRGQKGGSKKRDGEGRRRQRGRG